MHNLFNRFKNYLYLMLIVLISSLILAILYLFSNINYNIISTILIIINIIFTFLLGYLYSLRKNEKGLISGLKVGSLYIIIIFFISLILHAFKLNSLMYYGIILLSTILGAIVGKNKR